MLKRKVALLVILFLLGGLALSLAIAYGNGEKQLAVKAALSGKVAAKGLIQVGEQVEAGTVLVNIYSFGGLAPTARAPLDGEIAQVLVSPGDEVQTGTVVVVLKAKN